jgi:signal transduction histidine kinase
LPLPDIFRTSTFRLAASFAAAFALSTLVLFAFIYWQTTIVESARIDSALMRDAEALGGQSLSDLIEEVKVRLAADYHRLTYACLFEANGRPLAGNLEALPLGLPLDGRSHRTVIAKQQSGEGVMMVGRWLADGRILVLGRSLDSLDNLRASVLNALAEGVLPTVLLSLLVGLLLSRRTQRQIKSVHQSAERIMRGDLRERLPVRGNFDDFDRLAGSVNNLLDEIERLVMEMKSTTDNIAHDLRTPLTRVRRRLERARETAQSHAELQEMVDRSIVGLDQTLRIITALLRIGQIESGQRRVAFSTIDLGTILQEIGDLYEPFAEEKGVNFSVQTPPATPIWGDRDLLCEAIANIVDNAIKFTPGKGAVQLSIRHDEGSPILCIADTGPGIPLDEREAVMRRFYRSDKSRHVDGCGLGLSLVDAIVKLHGFRLSIREGANKIGCLIELICAPQPSLTDGADQGHI